MAKKVVKKDISIRSSAAEYLTFVAATGDDKNSVEVRYEDENIWITQKMLAVLYEVDVRTINFHIKKIFEEAKKIEEEKEKPEVVETDNSFYTSTLNLKAKDFSDNEEEERMPVPLKIFIILLIIVLTIIFVVVGYQLIKEVIL